MQTYNPAQLLFLSKFTKPQNVDILAKDEGWAEVLKEKPTRTIERFMHEGLLREGDLENRLDCKFKSSELKLMLKQRDLKQSGRKEELIARLVEADRQGMENAAGNMRVAVCTEEGEELANRYLEEEEAKKAEAERQALEALKRGEFGKANGIIYDYESEQVFQRGMGVGLNTNKLLKLIFTNRPTVLKDWSDAQLEPFRIAAGMFSLGWNRGDMVNWLHQEAGIEGDDNLDQPALLLHSYATYLSELDTCRKVGIPKVEINTCNDYLVCESCRRFAAKTYKIQDVPEIPNPKCTSETGGCRCWIGGTLA